MDHLDTVNLQLIAAVGELRMAAVCLPTDAEAAEPIRRHLLAAERRVIEAHKAASAAATSAKADARPFGPGTLDVLLAAETADPGAVCDAIEATELVPCPGRPGLMVCASYPPDLERRLPDTSETRPDVDAYPDRRGTWAGTGVPQTALAHARAIAGMLRDSAEELADARQALTRQARRMMDCVCPGAPGRACEGQPC